jgi:predicted dehydrogenase
LEGIYKSLKSSPNSTLAVGFNRRFAPLVLKTREFFADRAEPLVINYRVNAGSIPLTHWTQDPAVGGGRIIGEGCHFIDLCTFIAGKLPTRVMVNALPDGGIYREDNVVITLNYSDGSIAIITYLANGDKSLSKETYEIFCGGKVARLDDFRLLELTRGGKTDKYRSNQDKGHKAAWTAFLKSIRAGTPPPIPYEELWAVHLATFAAVDSIRSGEAINL